MRPRDAPSAIRVATSRVRAIPRASSRPATFNDARTSSSRAPDMRTRSGRSSPARSVGTPPCGRHDVDSRFQEAAALRGTNRRKVLTPEVGLEHLLEPGLESRVRLIGGHARPQSANRVHPERAAIEQLVPFGCRLPLHHRRDPHDRHASEVDSSKGCRGDADDGHRVTVDEHAAPDNIRSAAQPGHPVVMREHDHRVRVGLAIVGRLDEMPQVRAHSTRK